MKDIDLVFLIKKPEKAAKVFFSFRFKKKENSKMMKERGEEGV